MARLRFALDKLRQEGDSYIGVEIGVNKGLHAEQILTQLDMDLLYLVDPYAVWGDHSEEEAKVLWDEAVHRLYPYREHTCWLPMRSDTAYRFLPEVDFVYVDGSHKVEDVYLDLKYYWPKVKPGGLLCGHDWADSTAGAAVKEAAAQFMEEENLAAVEVGEKDTFHKDFCFIK